MSARTFTDRQGQYLAFIDAYTRVTGRPPAESDIQRRFGVSPPSVHQMVLTLERAGLIRPRPGVARSIEVLVTPELLPVLRCSPPSRPEARYRDARRWAPRRTRPSRPSGEGYPRDAHEARSRPPRGRRRLVPEGRLAPPAGAARRRGRAARHLRGMARLRRGAPGAAEAGRHRRREGAARPRRVLRLVRRARLGARCPGQVAVRQRGRRRRAPAPALSEA